MRIKKILILTISATLPGLAAWAADTNTVATNANASMMTMSSDHGYSDHAGKFGIGATFGEPIGADMKYWLNNTMAIDGAIGWSTHDDTDLYLHSDVLWHKFNLFPVSQGQLPLYFGVGALMRFRSNNQDNQAGIRVPVGVSYMFDNAPVDIFAEIAPALDVAPFVRGEITGGVGIRYWF